MKATHESTEAASYKQMDEIFRDGCYKIGSSGSHNFQKAHEIIQLYLKGKDKKKTYEDLRDLESKLVLITDSKAENRKEVTLFIDVSIHTVFMVCF